MACPYKDCSFTTNVYSSFNSHKSRSHQASVSSDFQNDIVSEVGQASIPAVDGDLYEEPPGTDEDPVGDDGQCDTDELKKTSQNEFIFLIFEDAGNPTCLKHSYPRNSGAFKSGLLLISAFDQGGN